MASRSRSKENYDRDPTLLSGGLIVAGMILALVIGLGLIIAALR